MSEWTLPAYVGVVGGLLVFAVFFIPIVAIQYRLYGRLSGRRLLGVSAISIYATALVAYTLLPLPAPEANFCDSPTTAQLVPFHFLADIARENAGLALTDALTSRVVLQVVFNIVLFVPLGVILRGFYAQSLVRVIMAGLGVSLLIELTQLTGLWGIYDCAYRLADVDDVLANTAGALIGGLIGPLVLRWIPTGKALRATRAEPRAVTVKRRALGMLIDLTAWNITGTVCLVIYRSVRVVFGMTIDTEDAMDAALSTLVPFLVVFFVPALIGKGASLGQRAVWLSPVWHNGSHMVRRLVRASAVGGTYSVLSFIDRLPSPHLLTDLAGSAASLVLIIAAISILTSTTHRGVSGWVSGAGMEDERKTAASET